MFHCVVIFLRDMTCSFDNFYFFLLFYSKIANYSLCQTSRKGFQVGEYYILQTCSIFHKARVRECSQPVFSQTPVSSFFIFLWHCASFFFFHSQIKTGVLGHFIPWWRLRWMAMLNIQRILHPLAHLEDSLLRHMVPIPQLCWTHRGTGTDLVFCLRKGW